MPAYLVRTIDEHDLVGFFFADEMQDLLIAVDECAEPDGCEYIELPPGGVMWTSPAKAVPFDLGDDETNDADAEQMPWCAAQLSDLWWNAVYGFSDEVWTEFFPGSPP